MKKYSLLTILFISIILLTGCSLNKKAITADNFYESISNKGYVLYDMSAQYGIANKAYQNKKDDFSPTILFIEGKKVSDMQAMFLDESKNIYNKAGIQDEVQIKEVGTLTTKAPNRIIMSGKDWESLEITTTDKYYYVIYVNKTLLYLEGTIDQKDQLKEIKDTIKY